MKFKALAELSPERSEWGWWNIIENEPSEIMRSRRQKRSALKLAGRIIP
jgi:hypothetical protein